MKRLKGRGVLITFEGIEGSGKTTQMEKLARALKKDRSPVVATQEPGGTPFGAKVRHLLVGSQGSKLTGETELFLFLADRAHHIRQVILPALQKKAVVLSDRFIDSTIAYQAFGRQLSETILDGMNKLATGGLEPDLTFFLDLPVTQALQRVKGRGKANRLDRESAAFYGRVRRGYYFLARKNKRIVVLDASRKAEEVAASISKIVTEFLLPRS